MKLHRLLVAFVSSALSAGSLAQSATQPSASENQTKRAVGEADADALSSYNAGCRLLLGRYTVEQQRTILARQEAAGLSLAQQIETQMKMVNDPVVVEYVNAIAEKLVRNSDAQIPFRIKIIDSAAVNALSLPGGVLYINSGTILAADEEAELAGVMAHEIAHVTACHTARQWLSTEGRSTVSSTPFTLGPSGTDDMGGGFGIARFVRGLEREADYLGIQYLSRAGYDPSALASYFRRIDAMEKRPWKVGAVASTFVTHRQNPDRIEKSEKEVLSILSPGLEYLVTNSEFDRVKARLAPFGSP